MSASLDITDGTGRVPASVMEFLTRHVMAAFERLGGAGAVRVRVVDDEEMARAHEEFAGVPGTTDVLTFDLSDPEEHRPQRPSIADVQSGNVRNIYGFDSDILICLDEAERQAGQRGYPFERELLLYIVHGMLHCLGFDDHDDRDFAEMHAMEDALLGAIGVGAVFHRPREAG